RTVQYGEAWHRRDWRSRYDLAGVMRDISCYVTLSNLNRVLHGEVADAFRRRLSLPTIEMHPIGWGVRNAFDHPLGRMRAIDPENDDGGPGEDASPEMLANISAMGPLGFEWMNLAGPDADYPEVGIDVAPRHRHGTAYAEEQHLLLKHLEEDAPPGRRDDAIMAIWIT